MDNELETLKRARKYISSMARGLDPLTELSIEEDSLLNNPRIIRCLYYVTGILDQVIDNGGKVIQLTVNPEVPARKIRRENPFAMTEEQLDCIGAESHQISISALRKKINEHIPENMKKLEYKQIVYWLEMQGILTRYVSENGKNHWKPTAVGESLGFVFGTWSGQYGSYSGLKLNADAQAYVLSHIPEIAAWDRKLKIDPDTGEVLED